MMHGQTNIRFTVFNIYLRYAVLLLNNLSVCTGCLVKEDTVVQIYYLIFIAYVWDNKFGM